MSGPKATRTVSVVVPVKNERAGFEALLRGILSQSPRPDEVTVVDAGSTDGTRDLLERLRRYEPRLKVIDRPGALPGAGRNCAIAATRADWIVQIDGGCAVDADWLRFLLEPLTKGEADYVTGNIQPLPVVRRFMGETIDMGAVFSACTHPVMRGPQTLAGGASVAYRRGLWEKTGGHPEWLRCGEDVLFALKIERLGIRHAFAADSLAYWQVGPRLGDVLAREIRYAAADVQLSRVLPYRRGKGWKRWVAAGLVAGGFFWPWAFALAFSALLAVWGRRTGRSVELYSRRKERASGKRRRVLYLLTGVTQLAVMGARLTGTGIGIWRRALGRWDIGRVRAYLEK